MARPDQLRCGLVLALLWLSGCTWGISQLALYPAVGGQYDFSGAHARVKGPADTAGNPFEFDLELPARKGRVEPLAGIPQITLGFDTPSWRLTVNPSFTADEAVEHMQFDLYYKHLLARSRRASWRLMAGISFAKLDTVIEQEGILQLQSPIEIEGARLQDGDKVVYRSSATDSGVYLGVGIELELTTWLHAFAMVQARMNSSQGAEEQLDLIAREGSTWDDDGDRNKETFNVLDDDRFSTTMLARGAVTSSLNLPPMVAVIGVALNFPTWSWLRRTFTSKPTQPPPAMWLPPRAPPYPQRPPRPPSRPGPQSPSHPPPATPYPGSQ